jgi:hypothetical protein
MNSESITLLKHHHFTSLFHFGQNNKKLLGCVK